MVRRNDMGSEKQRRNSPALSLLPSVRAYRPIFGTTLGFRPRRVLHHDHV